MSDHGGVFFWEYLAWVCCQHKEDTFNMIHQFFTICKVNNNSISLILFQPPVDWPKGITEPNFLLSDSEVTVDAANINQSNPYIIIERHMSAILFQMILWDLRFSCSGCSTWTSYASFESCWPADFHNLSSGSISWRCITTWDTVQKQTVEIRVVALWYQFPL